MMLTYTNQMAESSVTLLYTGRMNLHEMYNERKVELKKNCEWI